MEMQNIYGDRNAPAGDSSQSIGKPELAISSGDEELAGFPVSPASGSGQNAGGPSTGSISNMITLLLAFVLILCLWDTWSTFTDIVAPMYTHLVIRSVINITLFGISMLIITRFGGNSKRLLVLGNLLAGVAIWEFTEALIEVSFGEELGLKFLFYASVLVLTYGLVVYLEKTHRLNIVDSGILSPL